MRDSGCDLAECGVALTGAAAVRLYDDHVDAIHALIARRIGPVLSPSATGEAFKSGLARWAHFDRNRGTERLFLIGAATETIRNYSAAEQAHLFALRAPATKILPVDDPLVRGDQARKPRTVDRRTVDADTEPTPPATATTPSGQGTPTPDDFEVTIRAACDLTAEDRDIITLSLWEGCSQNEIAEALDVPVSMVRSALGRIRRELKVAVVDGNTKRQRLNVFDAIRNGRPTVDPMPLAQRRVIRESLFGLGHDDADRHTAAHSESGATVSTAPHGLRVPVQGPHRAWGSFARMAAGFGVVAAAVFVLWKVAPDGEDSPETTSSVAPTSVSTPTPDTVLPISDVARTNVTRTMPLVLPQTLMTIDEAAISPPGPGGSSLLLEAPDGTNVWVFEVDGSPGTFEGLNIGLVGSVGVAVTSGPNAPAASYRFFAPCGLVLATDAPGQPPLRPEMVALFEALSFDDAGTLDGVLPTGWRLVDVGASRVSYSAQFQVPVSGGTVPIRLTQIPDGVFAQLAFGGVQLEPITFLDGPAFIDSAPAAPGTVSILWKDGNTVFNVSTDQAGQGELESFVESLEPATVAGWSERFTRSQPPAQSSGEPCSPQPSFGPRLNP